MKKKLLAGFVGTFLLFCMYSAAQAVTINFTGHLSRLQKRTPESWTYDYIDPNFAIGDTFSGSFIYSKICPPENVSEGATDSYSYRGVISDFSLMFNTGNSTGFTLTNTIDANDDARISISNATADPWRYQDITSTVIDLTQSDQSLGLDVINIIWRLYDDDGDMFDNSTLKDLDYVSVLDNIEHQSNDIQFYFSDGSGVLDTQWVFDTISFESSTVPIPGSAWLLSTGLFCLVGLTRTAFHTNF